MYPDDYRERAEATLKWAEGSGRTTEMRQLHVQIALAWIRLYEAVTRG